MDGAPDPPFLRPHRGGLNVSSGPHETQGMGPRICQIGAPVSLSVIIPARDAAATIGDQLSALSMQDWDEPWEVIVVDNGSTDGTPELVERFQASIPHLRILDAGPRAGPGRARNAGIRSARSDHLAFTDADDVVGAEWVATMASALRRSPVVCGRLEYRRLNSTQLVRQCGRPQTAGLQTTWYPPGWPHGSGCNLGARRAALDRVDGFDEELPCLTDTDLCLRLQAAGVRLEYVAGAVVHYRWRRTEAGAFRQARNWARINTRLYRDHTASADRIGSWLGHAKDWLRLAGKLPKLRDPVRRGQVLRAAGHQLGLLLGAARFGVAPLPARVPSGPLPGSIGRHGARASGAVKPRQGTPGEADREAVAPLG